MGVCRTLLLIFALGALIVACLLGSLRKGDGTAQGVAKARHMETMYPIKGSQKRLFEDPYAHHFYLGSSATAVLVEWMGFERLVGMVGDMGASVQCTLSGRTAEFDSQIRTAVAAGIKQYVVLGAGYDTRSLRLGLPRDVNIFEVDQPKVQEMKRAKLAGIPGLTIPGNVHFVPIDFNVHTLVKLREHPSYDPVASTIFTMEGVTQYIPKEATASTLATAASISGDNSRFLISYVPQDLWDAPEKCGDPASIKKLLWLAESGAGEPWIAGWHPPAFAELMQAQGFNVQRDIAMPELHEDYFVPAARPVPEKQRVILERYVTAIKK